VLLTLCLLCYLSYEASHTPGDAQYITGSRVPDDDCGEEADGYDEVLCPVDGSFIRDDTLYDILVKPAKNGVHMFFLMDCCHSGSILDLPYTFKADGKSTKMHLE